MYTQCNDSAGRARNILNAWQQKDLAGLRAELARSSNPQSGDTEEQERMDLLQTIACQMEQDLPGLLFTGQTEVSFRLLEHLALSGSHPAIRPRLAFFPY